jgi:hypothetical protein
MKVLIPVSSTSRTAFELTDDKEPGPLPSSSSTASQPLPPPPPLLVALESGPVLSLKINPDPSRRPPGQNTMAHLMRNLPLTLSVGGYTQVRVRLHVSDSAYDSPYYSIYMCPIMRTNHRTIPLTRVRFCILFTI